MCATLASSSVRLKEDVAFLKIICAMEFQIALDKLFQLLPWMKCNVL